MTTQKYVLRILGLVLNVSSLILILILTSGLTAIGFSDLFFWCKDDLITLLTFGAAIVFIILGFIIISSSRKVTSNFLMQDIPKLYIPIGNSDLSTSSYRLVQEELLNSASVSLKLRPLEQKDLGWGQGPFLNVHLKTSCINTFYELEQQLSGISFHLSRQNRTARLYFQFLIQQQIIPETLGMAYLDWWETLRYSTQEMTEQEFRDFLKLFTGLRRSIPLSL